MKKILALASIRNRTLRSRADFSPLRKTAVHRFHYDSEETFNRWQQLLTPTERRRVFVWLGFAPKRTSR